MKEMTQLPPFCFHSLRHASVRSESAAGERAAGYQPDDRLPGPGPPAPTLPAGGPGERPKWRLGLEPPSQAWDPPNISHPGAPRRGRGAGSSEAGPEAATEPSRGAPVMGPRPTRGQRGVRGPPACPARPRSSRRPRSRQKSTFRARISSNTPLFLLEQVNVRVGP